MRAPSFWEHNGLLPRLLTPLGNYWQDRTNKKYLRKKPAELTVPVICVGNAVAGGAGKTPVVLSIAENIKKYEISPHLLSRGYGGRIRKTTLVDLKIHTANDVGDEPLLLAAKGPTWVTKNRNDAGVQAIRAGAEMLIMDDGLQNPDLCKDLSILVIDGGYGFGNGKGIPAGPLRDSIKNVLKRTDAIVIIGEDKRGLGQKFKDMKPILHAEFIPDKECHYIAGKRVIAFAGIGRPSKFFKTLSGLRCEIIEKKSFPDHHLYSPRDIRKIMNLAEMNNATPVTTEKDFVRLPVNVRNDIRKISVTLKWQEPRLLDNLVLSAIQNRF